MERMSFPGMNNRQQLRRWLATALGCAAIAGLAACSVGGSGRMSSSLTTPESTGAVPSAENALQRQVRAKVALLLPLTGTARTAAIAKGMKQAAEMALFELNNPGFQMVVQDTRGTPEGAAAAATRAAADGVELLIGPLYAQSVTAVANVARQANLPVVAFSNNRTVAGNGVYLLSFTAQEEVERIVSFATSRGKRRYAALLPENTYGQVMDGAFRSAVQRNGGSIIALEKYPANSTGMLEPSERLFELVKGAAERGAPIDAIFMPAGPDTLPNLAPLVRYANLGAAPVTFLGSGGWDYPNIGRNQNLIGSWYPAPDPSGWRAFSEKFARNFGSAPPRIATLSYDALTVAIRLATAHPPGERFSAQNLTRPNGFVGIDGAFRLSPDGTAEHSLAILEVQQFEPTIVDPARPAFGNALTTGAVAN